MNRVVFPGALSGQFRAPASKSHAHRLLICAALGHASVRVSCDTFSDDILATIDCLNAMGAKITHEGGTISVSPIFANGSPDGACQLYCKESGSTLRFLLPVVGALGLDAVFHMEGRLPERPLHPFDEVLIAHGMHIHQTGAELHVSGKLLAGSFTLPGNVSSQYLSGLLFALPLLPGSSTLTITGALQSASYLAMTEDAVLNSGIRFSKSRRRLVHPGRQSVPAASRIGLAAEGDWSGAAFLRCASARSADTGVTVASGGGARPRRQADRAVLCSFCARFGAEVRAESGRCVTVTTGRAARHQRSTPAAVPGLGARAWRPWPPARRARRTSSHAASACGLKECDRLHTVGARR